MLLKILPPRRLWRLFVLCPGSSETGCIIDVRRKVEEAEMLGSLGFSMTFVIALRTRMDIAARRLRTLKTPSSSNGIVRWD